MSTLAPLKSLPPLTGDTSWIDTYKWDGEQPIAPARPGSAASSAAAGASGSAAPQSTAGVVASAIADAAKQTAGGFKQAASLMMGTPLAKFFGVDLEDVTFIVLGLVLVAAAAFSFKTVQDAGREFTRAAVKAAAAP